MKRILALTFALCCIGYGHVSQAQILSWTPSKGPYSTAVNAFDTAGGLIFAGTKAGLYQSTNSGASWTLNPYVLTIVYDIARAGSDMYTAGAGISRSTDGGITWIARDSGLPLFPLIYLIKSVHDTLYACMGGEGLYRSVDSGKYWAQPSPDIANKTVNTMIWTGTSIILSEGAGILRSTDNGFSWDEPGGLITGETIHSFALKDNVLFAGTEAGVFRSSDDGITWAQSGTGMASNDIVTSLIVSGDDKMIFAGTANSGTEPGVYRSNDGGNTWHLFNNGLTSLTINSLFTSGTEIFAGTALGISSSNNNGDLWQTTSDGLPEPGISSITSTLDYYVLAGTAGSYLFGFTDRAESWLPKKKGLTRPNVNALLMGTSLYYAGTDALPKQGLGGLHRSTDYGDTWTQVKAGIPLMSVTSILNFGSEIFCGGDSGIYSSSDDGLSWKFSSASIPKAMYTDDTLLYISTKLGIDRYSKSAGWVPGTSPVNRVISAFTKTGTYLYAATDSGVYRDSLSVWKLVTGDTLTVQSLWSNNYIIVAGTKTGLFVSSDQGTTWQYQQSAGAVSVNAFCTAFRNLYAATSTGVIRAPLAQFSVKSLAQENPLLFQVTNPSSNQAIIRYHLNLRGNTTIAAFDLLGKERAVILNGEQDSGEFNLEWNTTSLASGDYILQLVSGGRQASAMISIVH